MLERILEFSQMLRLNGVRVSVAENMDAVRALELLGIGDRTLFKSALRASLVKRSIDVEPFNRLFELYFLGRGQSSRAHVSYQVRPRKSGCPASEGVCRRARSHKTSRLPAEHGSLFFLTERRPER